MKNISKSNLELNKKIQENLNILNELLSQAPDGLCVIHQTFQKSPPPCRFRYIPQASRYTA